MLHNDHAEVSSSEQSEETYRRCDLYLMSNGSRLELKAIEGKKYCYDAFKATNVHPVLLKAKQCNTHEKVLALLEEVKKNPECNVELYYSDISHFFNYRTFERIKEPNIDIMIDGVKKLQKQDTFLPSCVLS